MFKRIDQMEFWELAHKSIILLYVIVTAFTSEVLLSPWYTLFTLLYLCVNISVCIVTHDRAKQLFVVLSILLVVLCAPYVHTLFILLLPMSLYELVYSYTTRIVTRLLFMLFPMLFIEQDMLILYGCLTLLSLIVYTIIRTYGYRIAAYRNEMERMHDDIQRLSRSLSDNDAYLTQSEYTSKLEERNRLSQEIHDKIGHAMTGALIQMEASKTLFTTNPEESVRLMQNAINISKEGIDSIDLVLNSVKPTTEQLGINRMKMLIDAFSATHLIRTVLTYKGNIDIISPIQWKIIQENTQEAMTNAVKYSGGTLISIDILVLHTVIKLDVSDNGNGAQKVVKGLGILGMEERTATINGKIIVDGSKGFSVTTLLPANRE